MTILGIHIIDLLVIINIAILIITISLARFSILPASNVKTFIYLLAPLLSILIEFYGITSLYRGASAVAETSLIPSMIKLLVVDSLSLSLSLMASLLSLIIFMYKKMNVQHFTALSLLHFVTIILLFSGDVVVFLVASQSGALLLAYFYGLLVKNKEVGFGSIIGWEEVLLGGMSLIVHLLNATSFNSMAMLIVAGGAVHLQWYIVWALGLVIFSLLGKMISFPLVNSSYQKQYNNNSLLLISHLAYTALGASVLIVRISPIINSVATSLLPALLVILSALKILLLLASIFQTNIWKIIYLLSLSQILFVFSGIMVGAVPAAIYHLLCTALLVALLLEICFWVVDHHGGTTEITKLGGMYYKNPRVLLLGTVLSLAMLGFPISPLLISKGEIIGAIHTHSLGNNFYVITNIYYIIMAFSITRFISLVFFTKDYRLEPQKQNERVNNHWSKSERLVLAGTLFLIGMTALFLPSALVEDGKMIFSGFLLSSMSPAVLQHVLTVESAPWSSLLSLFLMVLTVALGLFLYLYLSPMELMSRWKYRNINLWTTIHHKLDLFFSDDHHIAAKLINHLCAIILWFEDVFFIRLFDGLKGVVAETSIELRVWSGDNTDYYIISTVIALLLSVIVAVTLVVVLI